MKIKLWVSLVLAFFAFIFITQNTETINVEFLYMVCRDVTGHACLYHAWFRDDHRLAVEQLCSSQSQKE